MSSEVEVLEDPTVCCSQGSCCRLGQEQSAMRGEGSRPHIGIVGRGWNKSLRDKREETKIGGVVTPICCDRPGILSGAKTNDMYLS
jgi:hypothetical protein